MNASAGKRDQGSAPGVASANAAPPAITSGPAPETEGGAGSSQSVDASGPELFFRASNRGGKTELVADYLLHHLMGVPMEPRKRKTMDEKIADLRRREAWKKIRQAEKLEAKANALRAEAAVLTEAAS